MMSKAVNTRQQGYRGEEYAAFYLQAKGYHIADTNWQHGRYELDIVAYEPENKILLFVEVKSAQTIDAALRHFTQSKVQTLCLAMEYYLEKKNIKYIDCQLDLIALSTSQVGHITTIEHITHVL